MALEIRNQFLHDGVAVRTIVGGIHGVGIVKKWCWMLKGNGDHRRKLPIAPEGRKLCAAAIFHPVLNSGISEIERR